MSLLSHLLSLLFLIPSILSRLPHHSILFEPATLGSTAHLRCSKVIQRMYGDAIEVTQCFPDKNNNNCTYWWSREGQQIEPGGESRYSITNFYTYGYCAITPGSEDMAKRMGLGNVSTELEWMYHSELCYNTMLTIANVSESDLGVYNCTLSDVDKGMNQYWSTRDKVSENITLYNVADSTFSYPKEVTYFQSIRPSSAYTFVQCVTTGSARVTWKIRFVTRSCPYDHRNKLEPCESDTWMSLDQLKQQDVFLCFNYIYTQQLVSHPSQLYSESIIKLSDISCPHDASLILYCIEDENTFKTTTWENTSSFQIVFTGPKLDDSDWMWHNNMYDSIRMEPLYISIVAVSPTALVCLVAAMIVALVRGSCCVRIQRDFQFTQVADVQQPLTPFEVQSPLYVA